MLCQRRQLAQWNDERRKVVGAGTLVKSAGPAGVRGPMKAGSFSGAQQGGGCW